ncbi:hypothetical protein SDRG_15222 [Saprolegnia diclina VS20]|uniref:Fibronectin type-III domain-containing protein n=1 Tax=Saprolegnia diclina (strain VS20) TaxID=1156394 RepID=T0R4L6_SAPDV|nr:hypothetical protein SDRG_15222 [Saprolegnia diclina VS20]EQC27008.1 hypothetical protein SDRG_15222 [Saprolegnia diclina VS20]|eukprot:XP_008619610.1 hypothetical protein SDRG_15222 [Saprolegnia diclina VS20]
MEAMLEGSSAGSILDQVASPNRMGRRVLAWSLLVLLRLFLAPCSEAAVFYPEDVPSVPSNVYAYAENTSALRVQVLPPYGILPLGSNGEPVLAYQVDVATRIPEVQTFAISSNDGPIASGTYRLSLTNAHGAFASPNCVAWNATATQLALALNELPNIDGVSVTQSAFGAAPHGFIYTISFTGPVLANGPQPNVLVGSVCSPFLPASNLVSLTGARVTPGTYGFVPEVWQLMTTTNGVGLGGTMDLSVGYQGDWVALPTVTISVDAGSRVAVTTVANSLKGLLSRGDVVRIGGQRFRIHASAPFTDVQVPLDTKHILGANNVPVYVYDTAVGQVAVTQGSATVATSTDLTLTVAVGDDIQIGGQEFSVHAITTSTVTLGSIANELVLAPWTLASSNQATVLRRKKVTVRADATPREMQALLSSLPGLGTAAVSRVGPSSQLGYVWSITLSSLGPTSCPTSPCLRVDPHLTDEYGGACVGCAATLAPVPGSVGVLPDFGTLLSSTVLGSAVYEVQSITTSATTGPIGGYFYLNFGAYYTSTASLGALLKYNELASDVQTKLQALPTIGSVNVSRTAIGLGYQWLVTFTSNMGPLPLLSLTGNFLSGAGATITVAEVTNGVPAMFETVLGGVSSAAPLAVRARAQNGIGWSPGSNLLQAYGQGTMQLQAYTHRPPTVPQIASILPVSFSQLQVTFVPPTDSSDITSYEIEATTDAGFGTPMVVAIDVYSQVPNDMLGTFQLSYGSQLSQRLPVDASASALAAALNRLPTMRPVTASRLLFVLGGGSAADAVSAFSSSLGALTLGAPLTSSQVGLLPVGTVLVVNQLLFTVASTPLAGDIAVAVTPNVLGTGSFAGTFALFVVDTVGSVRGPLGYRWRVTFPQSSLSNNRVSSIDVTTAQGLKVVSSLTSVASGATITTPAVAVLTPPTFPAHYSSLVLSASSSKCNTFVVGPSSATQILQLFAPTTVSAGSYQLQLEASATACIPFNAVASGSAQSLKTLLMALPNVGRVSVERTDVFKQVLLPGSQVAAVTGYSSSTGLLTIVSTGGPGLTTAQAAALPVGALLRVQKNAGDTTQDACTFTVSTAPAAQATTIAVALPDPSKPCATFTGESRSLRLFDLPTYKIQFYGDYPTGVWPTLRVLNAGSGSCAAWAPAVAVKSRIGTLKYEGPCASGSPAIQTLIADADSPLGGTFTLFYRGLKSAPLSVTATTAAAVAAAMQAMVNGPVTVTTLRHRTYGRAWQVTFAPTITDAIDTIVVDDAFLTGTNAVMQSFPVVEFTSTSALNSLSGDWTIALDDTETTPIGVAATMNKVIAELEKLYNVNVAMALTNVPSDQSQIGYTALALSVTATANSPVLTSVLYKASAIDPSLYVVAGDVIRFNGETHTIVSVSSADIVLADNAIGGGTFPASAGTLLRSTTSAPGFIATYAVVITVVSATAGSTTLVVSAGSGIVAGDVISIGAAFYTVQLVNGVTLTLATAYAGTAVVASTPATPVYRNAFISTTDLSSNVLVGDYVWYTWPDGTWSEYVVTSVGVNWVTFTGVLRAPIVQGTLTIGAGGFRYPIVFKSLYGNLASVDALPGLNWAGLDARLRTTRPYFVAPNTVTLGTPSNVQTLTLSATSAAAIGTGATYTVSFMGETTTALPWSATTTTIAAALQALSVVDGVTVQSTAVGVGFVHTITFWGANYNRRTLPPLSTTFTVGTGGNAAQVSITQFTTSKGSPHTASGPWYTALNAGATYALRISATNAAGFGAASAAVTASTAMNAVLPSPPRGVTFDVAHGATWLDVRYQPPMYHGGAPIFMYNIEYTSDPTFTNLGVDGGTITVRQQFEIQQVATSFRSVNGQGGTFTLAFGGQVTAPLPYACSAAQMTSALVLLTGNANVPGTPIVVSRFGLGWGTAWKITFMANMGDLALLRADSTMLNGDLAQLQVTEIQRGTRDLSVGAFTYDVQDIYTSASSPLVGSFIVSFDGVWTAPISVLASALEMQTALQATSSIHSAKVSKTILSSALNTACWSVTFAHIKNNIVSGSGNIFPLQIVTATLTGTQASVQVAKKVHGTNPLALRVSGLSPGTKYYARVMAYNTVGYGSPTMPFAQGIPRTQPSAPNTVTTTVSSATALSVTWSPPLSTGGAPVDAYRVEWFRSAGQPVVQTITTSALRGLPEIQQVTSVASSPSLGGNFKLVFRGKSTSNIAWNAPATGVGSVQSLLQLVPGVGSVIVTSATSMRAVPGLYVLLSTATTAIAQAPTTDVATCCGFAVGNAVTIAGQPYTIATLAGTTITLTALGQAVTTTVPVPVFVSANGFTWSITFGDMHIGDVPPLVVMPSDNWGGTSAGIFVTTVQNGLAPIGGMFRLTVPLTVNGVVMSQQTDPIPFNASAADLQSALQALDTVSSVVVTQSPNGYGRNWFVTFAHEVANDVLAIVPDGSGLTGASATIYAAITSPGVQPTYYCESSGAAGTCQQLVASTAQTTVVPQLTTGVPYLTLVRARNSEGWSPGAWGLPQYETPRGISSAPTNVQLLVLSSTLLKVVWSPPANLGGTSVMSYTVQWDTDVGFSSVTSPGFDYYSVMIVSSSATGPFYYNIPIAMQVPIFARVAATNDRGTSDWAITVPSSVLPQNVRPGPPISPTLTVVSSAGYLVSWQAPSTALPVFGGSGGIPLTQYMIEWDVSPTFDSPAAFAMVSGTTLQYVIGGENVLTGVVSSVLTPGGTYFVRVSAFNGLGAGPVAATTPLSAVLSNQLPSTPSSLQLTDVSATSVLASWQTPTFDGGLPLQSYALMYDDNSSYLSGHAATVSVPIVREMQTLWVSTDPVSETQYIEATVQVTNERQTVRTTVTGVDEVQTISTSCANVVDEVQTITTSATDRNEVQTIVLDATVINEVQGVRTSLTSAPEIQTVVVGTTRVNEIQSFSITFTGITTTAGITGGLVISLDTTLCFFCANQMTAQTVDVTTAVTSSVDSTGASNFVTALQGLSNVDTVVVTRVSTPDNTNNRLTLDFSITFTGIEVAGNIPAIQLQSTLAPLQSPVPTQTSETQIGSNPVYNPGSVFRLFYTCEQYSDPTVTTGAFPGVSAACQPTAPALCATCATAFDGTTISVNVDLTAVVAVGAVLQIGPCVFGISARTATTLTVDTNNVGRYCSTFSSATLAVYAAKVLSPISNLVMRQGAGGTQYPEVNTVVATQFLNSLGKAVSVVATPVVSLAFVGTSYAISFVSNTGTIPLLTCDATNIVVTSGTKTCSVTRTSIGSMMYGTFTLSLTRASDGVLFTTPAIPFDATPAALTQLLQGVGAVAEWVWGTVSVTRSMYPPAPTRWSGGYAWTITFLSRGWNVPKMTFTSSLGNAIGATPAPVVVIEDATSLLTPSLGSVDGNQISGSFKLSYNGVVTAAACVLGTNTDAGDILVGPTVRDTAFETYLKAQFGWTSVSVYRSLPTRALGFTWSITYTDANTGGNVPLIQVVSPNFVGTGVSITTNEVVPGNQLSGTFQLTFNGQTTGPIAYDASIQDVATQLNNLNSIQPSQVTVSRIGPFGPTSGVLNAVTQVRGYQWSITFTSSTWKDPTADHAVYTPGNWWGPPAAWTDVWETGYSKAWGRHVGPLTAMGLQLSCLAQGLTDTANDGSPTCVVGTSQPGVGPLKGTFTLQLDTTSSLYMSKNVVATSAPIAHNAWATAVQSQSSGQSMQETLQAMTNVGTVAVTRSAVNVLTGGYTWTITFLYDKEPCAQHDSVNNLCNAPGNVPPLTVATNSLVASTPAIAICDQTTNPCGVAVDGVILRSSFSVFKVTGDPGVESRFALAATCQGATLGSTCGAIVGGFVLTTAQPNLPSTLLSGDQFYLAGYASCVFSVASVTPIFVDVIDQVCVPMAGGLTGGPFALTMVLPWNAQENAIARVLRAASATSLETGIWANGRVTSVTRTVIGQYGAMSWLIRFISNPGNSPPGAGNVAPLTVSFLAAPTCVCQVTVAETQPGSVPLGGSFTIDYHSTFGPRAISYLETADRLERKLNEMNTLGRVRVTQFAIPSVGLGCLTTGCAGGWDDVAVANDGTRGGYRWRVVFLKNPGAYSGYTFPPGTGNMNALTVSYPALTGAQSAVNVITVTEGNLPITGAFALSYDGADTPPIPYAASAPILEQAIEALPSMSYVPTTSDVLSMYRIPLAIATIAQDSNVATISGVDITQYFAPGDLIRFGPPPSANTLVGSNGDVPVTGVVASSTVTVARASPSVVAPTSLSTTLFPGNQVRLSGSIYTVARTGIEIQTLTVSLPTASWTPTNVATVNFYKLTLAYQGASTASACLPVQTATLATVLNGLVTTIDPTRSNSLVTVTQSPATVVGANTQIVYTIYFGGVTVLGDVAQLTVDTASCTALAGATATAATVLNGGRMAHQRVTLSTDSGYVVDPTGYYQLSLGGVATTCIKWGDTSAAIQAQVNAAWPDTVLVSSYGSGTSTTELQQLVLASNAPVVNGANGYFRLALTNNGATATTSCLNYGLSAAALQTALNGLSNVMSGHIVVTASGDGTAASGYGFQYTIAYNGNLRVGLSNVLGNMAPLVVFSMGTGACSPVSSGLPSIYVQTLRDGAPAYAYDFYFVGSSYSYVAPIAIVSEATCTNGWSIVGGSSRRIVASVVNGGGNYAVQRIVVSDATAPIAGTPSFKIGFLGQTTGTCVNYNAAASAVQTALNALSTIGANGVVVNLDIDPVLAPNGFVYSVTFTAAALGGTLPLLVVDTSSCTAFAGTSSVTVGSVYAGGSADNRLALSTPYAGDAVGAAVLYGVSQTFSVLNEQFAVIQIVVSNPNGNIALSATYDLTLGSTTTTVSWKATEVQLEAAFATLTGTASGVTVTVRTDPVLSPNGYLYTVYCLGPLVMGNIGPPTKSNLQNFGTGTVTVTTIRTGSSTNMLSASNVPLATVASAAVPATYIGSRGVNLAVYKVNGFQWSLRFAEMIGDVAALGVDSTDVTGVVTVFDNFVQGSPSNKYTVTSLEPGNEYYMRVAATTAIGSSPWSTSASIIPSAVPPPPVNVQTGLDLFVSEVQRVKTAARHVLEVQSVTTSAAMISEVQTLTVTTNPCGSSTCVVGNIAFRQPTVQVIAIAASATITAGQFQLVYTDTRSDNNNGALTYQAYPTAAINWNAQASDVAAALVNTGGLAATDIVVTRTGDGSVSSDFGYTFSVTFVSLNVAGQVAPMQILETAAASVACTAFATVGGAPYSLRQSQNLESAMGTNTAVQRLVVQSAAVLYTGGFTLSFTFAGGTRTTTCLPFNIAAVDLEAALELLSNIDAVVVVQSLDPVVAPNGAIYDIFFHGHGLSRYVPLQPVPALVVATGCTPFQTLVNNVLTATTASVAVTYTHPNGFASGFFAAATASASVLQADIARLPIGGPSVYASASLPDDQGGTQWTIVFDQVSGNVPQWICSADATFSAVSGATCASATIVDGNVLGGSFLLGASDPIPFDADEVTMTSILQQQSWVGAVLVTRTGPDGQRGYTWSISFLTYQGNAPLLTPTNLLSGIGNDIVVTEIVAGNQMGGTFTLTFLGATTPPIAWNAPASTAQSLGDGSSLQEKLQTLATIGALAVTRTGPDFEGGYEWYVTFVDNVVTGGSLPLLQANSAALTGTNTLVDVRRLVLGSLGSGTRLGISFDPPSTDNGSPITSYTVNWDTANTFAATPMALSLTDPALLTARQYVTTGASSLSWSGTLSPPTTTTQSIAVGAVCTSFTLSFMGAATGTILVGATPLATVQSMLNGLATINGIVSVTPTTGFVALSTSFAIVFSGQFGPQPVLVSSAGCAVPSIVAAGSTSYRKEVLAFQCTGTAGAVAITAKSITTTFPFNALLGDVASGLATALSAPTGGVTVTAPSQLLLCASATPNVVTMTFHYVYGALGSTAADSGTGGTTITLAPTSRAGIYVRPTNALSGTFQLTFNGATTPPLNAQSAAIDVRVALESLPAIRTASVAQSYATTALVGTVDVVQGQLYVTCASGQVCNFASFAYGVPGVPIQIGGTWYTVLSDTSSASLPSSALYLGDTNGSPKAFAGVSSLGVPVYQWTKGYQYIVDLLSVSTPGMLRASNLQLKPSDATVVTRGASCKRCVYVSPSTPGLTPGTPYFLTVNAVNVNGASVASTVATATPRQVPNAPNALNIVVISGTQAVVYFSPPAPPATSAINYNSDITSYLVQWDTQTSFLHGRPACTGCATAFSATSLSISVDLTSVLVVTNQITLGAMQCVLTITAMSPTTITVAANACPSFLAQAYDVVFYRIPPATVSGVAIQGTPPYQYLIQGLTPAVTYYVRLAAVNSVPFMRVAVSGTPPNNCQWSFPIAITPTNVLPDPVLSAVLYVQSPTSLELQIHPSARDGQGLNGAAVTFYSVDVDTVSTFTSAGRLFPVDVPAASFVSLYAGGPLTYSITGLVTGTQYFVQVRAKTSVGSSLATIATNTLAPSGPPSAPTSVRISTPMKQPNAPITQATVVWAPPTTSNGRPLSYFNVEWWTTASRAEVQVVQLQWTNAPTALTFTLAFGGSLTGSLAMDCAPENVRSALMNLGGGTTPGAPLIGNVEVTRSAINVNQGYQWSVTFATALCNQPLLQIAIVSSTGGSGIQASTFEAVAGVVGGTTSTPGTPEVQVLTITNANAALTTSGFFRLAFQGSSWSNYLPASAPASLVQNVLQQLATIGQVSVATITNGAFPANMVAYAITFASFVGNAPALAVDSSNLLPTSSVATVYDGNNVVLNTGAWCLPADTVCAAIYTYVRIGEVAIGYGSYATTAANVLTYMIPNLTTGTAYYASVTARNTLSFGPRAASYPVVITPPLQVPSPPTAVSVSVQPGSSTQLLATYSAPISHGGSPVLKYLVEYDTSPAFSSAGSRSVWCAVANVNAVWRVTSSRVNVAQTSPIGAGWFQLKLTRANAVWTTDPIPFNAVALGAAELGAQPAFSLLYCTACATCTDTCNVARQQTSGSLQRKLQGLASIANGVTVSRTPVAAADGGYVWSITFLDAGDDFTLEAVASSSSLNCAGSTCASTDYQVAAVKVTAGVLYPPCTGAQVIPAAGALTKGQFYYVRVTAFNAIGFGLPQAVTSPQKPMVVPGLPTGVTLTVNSISTLQVVFSPPVDNGGDIITSYTVTWSVAPDFSASPVTLVVNNLANGSPFTAILPGLTKGLFYFVQVQATNSQGTGLPALSSPLSLNPSTVPLSPTNVVLGVTSPSMLTVGWAPPADNGGDALTGYIIEWDVVATYDSLTPAPDRSSVAISDTTQTSYTITLLTAQTAYFVRVSAVNRLGPSAPQDAAPLPSVPALVAPGKPISLAASVVATPTAGIYVQWQAPYVPYHGIPCFGSLASPVPCPLILGVSAVYGGSGLRSYYLEWSTSSVFSGTNRVPVAGTNVLLTTAGHGIVSGTTYYMRIQAVNNNGYMSLFCQRGNVNTYLCPDSLLLPDGSFVNGAYVIATAP